MIINKESSKQQFTFKSSTSLINISIKTQQDHQNEMLKATSNNLSMSRKTGFGCINEVKGEILKLTESKETEEISSDME
jgi:hypothetical protein